MGHAQRRGQRSAHRDVARDGDGRPAAPLLGAVPPLRRTAEARLSAGPHASDERGARRVPRHVGARGAARGALPAPPREPLLRAERRGRPALHLPRLEVRRGWPVRGHALRAYDEQLPGQGAPDRLPHGRGRRRRLGVPRPGGADARDAGLLVAAHPAVARLRHEAAGAHELGAGTRGRHRLGALQLPARDGGRVPPRTRVAGARPGRNRPARPLPCARPLSRVPA